MRKLLANINFASAVMAGVLLVAIAVCTLIQITARTIGLAAHSWDEIAVYCMAGSTFMGLAYAWRTHAHIRMTLIVARLAPRARRVIDTLALCTMAAVVAYMTWYLIDMSYLSWEMNDVSQGLLPMPLWIPQAIMAIGSGLLLLAILETLYDLAILNIPLESSDSEDPLSRAASEA